MAQFAQCRLHWQQHCYTQPQPIDFDLVGTEGSLATEDLRIGSVIKSKNKMVARRSQEIPLSRL